MIYYYCYLILGRNISLLRPAYCLRRRDNLVMTQMTFKEITPEALCGPGPGSPRSKQYAIGMIKLYI